MQPHDEDGRNLYSLNEHEAFAVMSLFVNKFAARPGNDLIILLTDIDTTVYKDGGPSDPAAWSDWLECVESVKSASGGSLSAT